MILAVLCIFAAIIGVVLPGIPTFDFLFLATLFASRGSTRLHRWLHQNRYMRLLMAQYQGGFKHISRSRKWMMTVSMLLAVTMLLLSSLHLHLKLSILAVLSLCLFWIWTRSENK
ncbi:YbaN family protein [Acinetobacter bereziniae]|uniref:YbaN family protein n=1 Tax=Acinetobacter bereziniae TaxID=106648 RepID=UPI002FD9DE4D